MTSNFLKLGLFSILALSSLLQVSNAAEFKENAHYKRVSAAPKVQSDKIEITEFFLYSCSHCFELEPKLKKWLEINKEHIVFKRVPAVISVSWVTLAKTYYIAEKMNILEKIHEPLFKSIHNDKKVYLNEYKLAEFFENQAGKGDEFLSEFNSKDIIDKVSDARIASVNYQFRGVPALVINGEFKTAPFYNKNQEEMLLVLDHLLSKIKSRK